MNRITLLLAIHNHQPVGNFDFVIQDAYDRAYKPFIDIVERHPLVKISLHYSGILLAWLKEHHPEFLRRLRAMVQSGQVEFLTGAYYEAILPVIPEEDRRGQIKKLSRMLKEEFGAAPRGMWLAERVWEQSVTESIVDAGVDFTLLDDSHFSSAGLEQDKLLGYHVTEERGKTLSLFPMSKPLRYLIPFQPVTQTIEHLTGLASEEGTRTIVFADDGEKFGVWPTTHKHVYEDGWLEEFFSTLEKNSHWIRSKHFSEILREQPAQGRIYLPDASYTEMMHWVLTPLAFNRFEEFQERVKEDTSLSNYQEFVRGGYWRNFFAKYPEANRLHKKMLRLSERLHKVKHKSRHLLQAQEFLWAGQCNDAYWHGVFGGLYLPHLRSAAYRNLLKAENIFNTMEKGKPIRFEQRDFDCDGRDELLVESPLVNFYVKPDSGGSVFELDFLPTQWNLANVMTRREEGYHKKLRLLKKDQPNSRGSRETASIHDLLLQKETDLHRYLTYDWYDRALILDHFLGESVTLEGFSTCQYVEEGDFVNQPYEHSVEKKSDSLRVNLERRGHLWRQGGPSALTVKKSILMKKNSSSLEILYELLNPDSKPLELTFGIEFCFSLSAGEAPDRYYRFQDIPLADTRLKSQGEVENVTALALVDEWLGVEVGLRLSDAATIWRFPIETVSLSEGGFEKVYQGSVVFPHWRLKLEREWKTCLFLELSSLTKRE